MRERFRSLWKRLKAKGDWEEEYEFLEKHYSTQGRHYHNLEHVRDCLKEFDKVKEFAENPEALEMAIWYHDIIYNTKSKTNEEDSADYAYDLSVEMNLHHKVSKKVYDFIKITKHDKEPQDLDSKLIIDIDLSILGKESEVFNQYEMNIRKEYSWVNEQDFKKGRSSILKQFLKRDTIYCTEYFRNMYEATARENLQRSIAALTNNYFTNATNATNVIK